VILIVVAGLTLNQGSGSQGPKIGEPMPVFAAPLAASTLQGDANLTPAACLIKDPRAFVSCPAGVHRPLVVGFLTVEDRSCSKVIGSLAALASSFPATRFVAVGIHADRKKLAALALAHRGISVVEDRDGAVSNRYGVAACPTVVVSGASGTVTGVLIGDHVDNPTILKADLQRLTAQ
jgi:hypothetical protein